MDDGTLGKVKFFREDGELCVQENWNPSQIPRKERERIAETLRHIADAIEQDKFHDEDGKSHFHKAPIG